MMTERWENESLEHLVHRRLDYLQKHLPDTISSMIRLEMMEIHEETNEFLIKGYPAPWMVNFNGTLHGGICATYVDQAMGHIAFCLKPGPGITPTIDMNIKYHRPFMTDDVIIMRVKKLSQTKTLICMSCEAYREGEPDKVCISASATYFYKPGAKHL